MALQFLYDGYFAGTVGIGTIAPAAQLEIITTRTGTPSSDTNIKVTDDTAQAADVGGSINFTGKYTDAGAYLSGSPFIRASKKNATTNDYGYGLKLGVRGSGSGTNNVAMTIDSDSNVGIGTESPLVRLQLERTVSAATSRTAPVNLMYLTSEHPTVGFGGFGTAITHYSRTYQNSTKTEQSKIAFTQQGDSTSTAGSTIDFYTKTLSTGSVAPELRMRISYNGNVGIGTASPSANLDILNGTTGASLKLSATATAYWQLQRDSTTGNLNISDDALGNVMSFDQLTGNVGIGTDNPGAKLEVNSDGFPQVRIHDEATGGEAGIRFKSFTATANDLHGDIFVEHSSGNETGRMGFRVPFTNERLTILSTGNVGIGTTDPLAINGGAATRLHTKAGVLVSEATEVARFEGGLDGDGASAIVRINTSNDRGLYLEGGRTGVVNFGAIGTTDPSGTKNEAIRIDNTGNVGIGTDSPDAQLHVNKAGTSGAQQIVAALSSTSLRPVLQFSESTSGSLNTGMSIEYNGTGSGDTNYMVVNSAANVPRFTVMSGGNVGIGTIDPQSKLQVDGGIQMADDTDTAVVGKVGTMRYRTGTEYVEVTGTELVTNGDFATDTVWVKSTTQWTISGGKANFAGASTSALYQSITLTSGVVYRVRFNVSGSSGSGAYIWIGNSGGSVNYLGGTYKFYADGDFEEIFTMPSNQTTFTFYSQVLSSSFSMDNVTLMEVTSEDASYADMCMQTGASTYEWVNIVRNTY